MMQAKLVDSDDGNPNPVECRGCGKVLAYTSNEKLEGICKRCGLTDKMKLTEDLSRLGGFCG